MTYLLIGLIGLAGGILSGLFGIGGGLVIVPGLGRRRHVAYLKGRGGRGSRKPDGTDHWGCPALVTGSQPTLNGSHA